MKKIAIYSFLVILVSSCGTSKVNNSTQEMATNYKDIASEKLGEDISYTMNKANSYALCKSEIIGTPKQPRNNLSYVVINLKDNSIVLEDKIDGGTVNWLNNSEIEVYIIPGIMRNDQTKDDYTTIYNIETGNSRKKSSIEQD